VLIIPICGEADDFLKDLMRHQKHSKVLVILIVNRPEGHENTIQWKRENESLIQHLSEQYAQKNDLFDDHQLLMSGDLGSDTYDILLLNFNAYAFDSNKGVGLARKIAADTALSLINKKHIKKPWIFSTDADVVLPKGYFETVNDVPKSTAALSLRFEHTSNDSIQTGLQQQYDFKLRYYQLAVRFIEADYDYIPLGSTLVIAAINYAQVRGFPCKSGGEDFYLLNKLAKTGIIYQPQKPIIKIKSRFSNRVPFGTGPAISKIQQQQLNGEHMVYYHPQIFHILKSWHLVIVNYYIEQQLPKGDFGLNKYWKLESVLKQAMSQVKSLARWQQFIHEWLDAFKILKSVHFLRNKFGSISYDELLESHFYQTLMLKKT